MTPVTSAPGTPRRKVPWLWLAAYAVTIAVVVLLVLQVRRTTLSEMSTPEAVAQWQAWREAELNTSDTGPVKRRQPSATEPPALILMRDYFVVVMSGAVLFSSLLFAAVAIAVRGALTSNKPTNTNPKRQRG